MNITIDIILPTQRSCSILSGNYNYIDANSRDSPHGILLLSALSNEAIHVSPHKSDLDPSLLID